SGGHRRHQSEPGCQLALIGGKRKAGGVGQPHDLDRDFVHARIPTSASAMRSTNARATSSLDCGGQDSTPSAVTRWTVLMSPPMTPESADTSLAGIQSHPLR